MKIALAHDSLTQLGGGERILQALHEIYPDAPVFTLVYDQKLKEHFEGWNIVCSPLQYLYRILPRFQLLLPLIPLALRFFDFSEFDLVISSSSIFIKAVHVPKKTIHVNYCHTPARFLWYDREQYLKTEVSPVLRPFLRIFLKWMQRWDFHAAQRVTHFIANSANVQNRIKKFYQRDSTVIYPWADTENFYPTQPKNGHYMAGGRLQPYKGVDLVIEVFNKIGKPLHVIGTGRAKSALEKMAKPNVTFLGRVSDEMLCREYSSARAFIYPQEEDFGIMPLEANACGTAVIAYGRGGVLESQVAGKTAIFFERQNPQSLIDAINKFEQTNFKSEDLFEQAAKYSKENFKQKIKEFIASKV